MATCFWSGAIARRIPLRVGDRSEHHLGLGRRRDDVGRHAADDQADRVVRLSEHRIGRQLDAAQRR